LSRERKALTEEGRKERFSQLGKNTLKGETSLETYREGSCKGGSLARGKEIDLKL